MPNTTKVTDSSEFISKEQFLDILTDMILRTDGVIENIVSEGYTDDIDADYINTILTCDIAPCLIEDIIRSLKDTESDYSVHFHEEGGGEGDGAEMWCVIKLTDKRNNKDYYLRYTGYYSSWDSSYYTDCSIVEPREVKVIQYFNV